MEMIEQIAMLEGVLQKHIRKWEMYFSGVERVPPQDERERINRRIRLLAEQTVNRRAEQFRIEQLQHRFQTYSQNWERMLREREEGRAVQPHTDHELRRPAAANGAATSSVDKAEKGSLFDRYRTAKSERGLDVGVDRETFDKQIAEQRKKIEERLGRKVRFDVQIEDDKVRVVARKEKKKG
ncbi:MAG: hypothetical protein OQK55_07285 [Thermoanaerobaculales bacterium]|nr:hypothetical protein [Thermoanaerobaculales bacterium]